MTEKPKPTQTDFKLSPSAIDFINQQVKVQGWPSRDAWLEALIALEPTVLNPAWPYRDGFLCIGCSQPHAEYTVTDATWLEALPDYLERKADLEEAHGPGRPSSVQLCLDCLRERLTRDLEPKDFQNDAPVNDLLKLGVMMGLRAAVATAPKDPRMTAPARPAAPTKPSKWAYDRTAKLRGRPAKKGKRGAEE